MGRPLHLCPVTARSPRDAARLGHTLLGKADRGETWLACSLVAGPVVVLGARQRRGAVTTHPAVVRRRTTGTAAWVGGRALWCSLALPSLDALFADATPATLLNRNVRPWLRGFTRSGIPAAYFGREWVAVAHRPAAVLGYELSPAGALLLEMIVGWDDAVALPAEHAAPIERGIDRWRGKVPVALGEGRDATAVLAALAAAVAERAGAAVDEPEPALDGWVAPEPPDEASGAAVPIGRVEAARLAGGGLWLGGDALVATPWLDALGRSLARGGPWPTEGAAVDGARADDWAGVVNGLGGDVASRP
jgi:hypothetical protein